MSKTDFPLGKNRPEKARLSTGFPKTIYTHISKETSMGAFILVDGMDGSGKGTIIEGLKAWVREKNLKILDLKEYYAKEKDIPQPEDIADYDVIFSSEPTYSPIGRVIADEMIHHPKREYSVLSTAWAFAIDREMLYNRVIIPALKQNKLILQERGVVTSLVYQPAQGRITLRELMEMPGNRLALKHAPNLMIITKVEPRIVIERLQADGRIGEAIFHTLNFQRTIDERYSSLWLKSLFEKFGTKIEYIDTNPSRTVEETKQEAIKLVDEFLAQKQ
jgi:dTMP kinase